jgi:phenylalanine-4-hydroxylase
MRERIIDWSHYSAEAHEVWRQLATRQLGNLRGRAWSRFWDGFSGIGMPDATIPRFEALGARLGAATGWSIEVVDGIIPVEEFFALLAQRRFCSSTWLRGRHQLDYLEEPDMFHDVFGHLPLLMDPAYARFVEALGRLGVRWADDPRALLLLERIYWFSIEFGLIREDGALRVLGAGILSSFGETNHVFTSAVALGPFAPETVLYQPFRNDQIQQRYFVVEHPNDLWGSLGRIETILEELAAGRRPEGPFRFAEQAGSAGVAAS